jgi:F420-non-reducing hydrogenase small subunit
MTNKVSMALYWAASCGGCEVAVLDVNERILDLVAVADIVFWPVGIDVKKTDIEAMEDGEIDLCLFNGAIRTSENEEMANLLRQKSKVMVAFGSCSAFGGIVGLANVSDRARTFDTVYLNNPTTKNPDGTVPQQLTKVPEGELTLPEYYDTVLTLDDVVDVDIVMPGCPPTVNLINAVIDIVAAAVNDGAALPPKGTVVASDKTLCDECDRENKGKTLTKLYRPHEITPNTDECLLDQGIICVGPATRAGCEARCINANMPCRGCMGPTAAVIEQGGSMLSAISSILDYSDAESKRTDEEIEAIMSQIVDPLGLFYRFTLPKGSISRVVTEKKAELIADARGGGK